MARRIEAIVEALTKRAVWLEQKDASDVREQLLVTYAEALGDVADWAVAIGNDMHVPIDDEGDAILRVVERVRANVAKEIDATRLRAQHQAVGA